MRIFQLCAAAILPLGLVTVASPADAAGSTANRCEYTESEESSHAVGVNATVTMSASAIVAKAEATFGVDYTYTSSKTTAWGYDSTVPSGKTSRGLILHRADKSGVKKLTYNPTTCVVSRTDDGTAWYPINSTANSTYCIARDDAPAFSGWRATCAVT
ncbi:hypothetical protein BJ986_002724 [Phycicoccus badiiscoriae]|uniref:Uncharacterized protein n=1 Tax=Pedococcus badiiscoriae TaxID=642776 RepID=A0A852WG94_9MICO|nr:hypothetical protein [Pedococcus badiiscoriae]